MTFLDRCRVYDLLRRGALQLTSAEWGEIAAIYHRAWLTSRSPADRAAAATAAHNAQL
jgi:hypothetical protein